MQEIVTIPTGRREGLYDITEAVGRIVGSSAVSRGVVNVYVQGATAAIMIQENWDESVQTDVIHLLQQQIPRGIWEHDKQDGNADSHLKAGIVGPSESVPIIDGQMGLSTWQNIFVCEFDGPRRHRNVVITITPAG